MRRPLLISLACGLAALALLFWGINPEPVQTFAREKRYVLLIERDTGAFLMQLRKGMQEAAVMGEAHLSVRIVGSNPGYQAAELAAEGVAAAMLLLDDPQPMLAALQAAEVPALVIGQTIRGQVCVVSDDAGAGEALLRHALALAEPSRILLLTDEEDSRGQERAAGASELARRNQIDILPWTEGMSFPAGHGVIVALSGRATQNLAAAKAAGALPDVCLVLGADTGDSRVADLESGRVAAMILDSPYAMGYIALEKALALTGNGLAPSLHLCQAPLIHPGNMYLSENVKIVFPLLQ